jgi:hypothetical protein
MKKGVVPSFDSGFRAFLLLQILLQKKTLGLHNPIDTLYHVTYV